MAKNKTISNSTGTSEVKSTLNSIQADLSRCESAVIGIRDLCRLYLDYDSSTDPRKLGQALFVLYGISEFLESGMSDIATELNELFSSAIDINNINN